MSLVLFPSFTYTWGMFASLFHLRARPLNWVLFLCAALGVSGVLSLAHSGSAFADYAWVNATTIQELRQTGQNNFETVRYYTYDPSQSIPPLGFSGGTLGPGRGAQFNTPPVDGYCRYHIILPVLAPTYNSASGMSSTLVTNERTSGACDKDDTYTDISIKYPFEKAQIHLYAVDKDTIKSIQPDKSATTFQRLPLTDANVTTINETPFEDTRAFTRLLSKADTIYFQTGDSAECPALLTKAAGSEAWGFVVGDLVDSAQKDPSSVMYRAILTAAGFDTANRYGNCKIGDNRVETKRAAESALGNLIFGTSNYWKDDFHPCSNGQWMSFRELHDDVVFCLGTHVVGTTADVPAITDPSILPTDIGYEEADNSTSCSIDGIGWILCPILNFMGSVSDASFTFLSKNFLTTSPQIVSTDSSNGTYIGWKMMRNIANVLFIIAFLFIVYSQMTGAGISNYGVKKMLPRLVVAAILVNSSFFLCQIAVDLSNILGFSIKRVFELMGQQSGGLPVSGGLSRTGGSFVGNTVSTVLAVGAGAAVIYLYLGALIPVLVAAVLGLVMILFILLARQALVVLLIVIAPVAFVAFLLPNTQKWFSTWRKTFTALLLVFPIIALVYGAADLASQILVSAFNPPVDNGVTVDSNVWGQIMAAAVATIPLFIVPVMLKKSLDGIGGIGATINRFGNSLSGRGGKSAGERFKNTAFSQGMEARRQAKRALRYQTLSNRLSGEGGADDGRYERSRRWLAQKTGRAAAGPGKAGERAQAGLQRAAATAVGKAFEEEVSAAMMLDGSRGMSNAAHLERLQTSTDAVQRAASIRAIQESGGMNDIRSLARISGDKDLQTKGIITGSDMREIKRAVAQRAGDKDPTLGGASMADIENGNYNPANSDVRYASSSELTARSLMNMHPAARAAMLQSVGSSTSPEGEKARAALRQIKSQIESTPDLRGDISQETLDSITAATGGAGGAGGAVYGAAPGAATVQPGATAQAAPASAGGAGAGSVSIDQSGGLQIPHDNTGGASASASGPAGAPAVDLRSRGATRAATAAEGSSGTVPFNVTSGGVASQNQAGQAASGGAGGPQRPGGV